MSATVVATFNQSSFAVAYADASALILDATASVDSRRVDLFARARKRAEDAIRHTDSAVEQGLARQLTGFIDVAQRQGWDRL